MFYLCRQEKKHRIVYESDIRRKDLSRFLTCFSCLLCIDFNQQQTSNEIAFLTNEQDQKTLL